MSDVTAEFNINQPEINAEFGIEQKAFDVEININAFPTDYINEISEGGGNIEAERNGKEVTLTNFTYVHNQGIAAKEWVINHNLKKYPSAFAVDSTGKVQIPDEIIYNDENTVTLVFLAAFAGKGYLN